MWGRTCENNGYSHYSEQSPEAGDTFLEIDAFGEYALNELNTV
jgi:hypothetical protein